LLFGKLRRSFRASLSRPERGDEPLKRLDCDLAEFHHARAMLQGKRPLGEKAIMQRGRLFAIEDRRDLPSRDRDRANRRCW
jgi:hypothetical protein